MPTLAIDPEKVCELIAYARQLQVKVMPVEPDPGSNMTDDEFREVLQDYDDDPTASEIREFIEGLNEEEYRNILALMWIGRGDYSKEEWDDIMAEAARLGRERGPDYLIGTPLLADYLEEGLNQLGYSCADLESGPA